ncbi:uncharacterized protein LOC110992480 [Pieris rapae]|uniref:uncharacterized protein LOC110992480 n=1 Tax=Pieris rapae TaxID=64459 RepID=UPI001E27FFAF|nr:uncharacterized protein LOC110992480 [Pieris rapae]
MIKTSKFLKTIFILQYLCGFYTDFFKRRKWNILFRILLSISIVNILYGTLSMQRQNNVVLFSIIALFNLFDYTLAVILSFVGGNVLHYCHRKLLKLDGQMRWRKINLSMSLTISMFLILFFEKSYIAWGYYGSIKERFALDYNWKDLVGFILWCLVKFGLLFNDFIRSLTFEWIWIYMRTLRKTFQDTTFKRKKLVSNLQTDDIERVIFGYIGTLESLNSMGLTFKILIFWNVSFAFIFTLIATVAIIYTPVRELSLFMTAEALYHIIIFLYPCVLIELTRSEVDKMKLLLTEIYTLSSDDKILTKAEDALLLLEVRPFQLVVFRLISMNIHLPLHFLAVMTSYVIVTVQFTHAFG